MADREGVTRYELAYRAAAAPPASLVAPLIAWRTILRRLGLVGQDPQRYEGLGFGNLSCRTSADGSFVISGTRTGYLEALTPRDFCLVRSWDIRDNHLTAAGPIRPSSEALTHAAVYGAAPSVVFVFHGHHPAIWEAAGALDLPQTPSDAPYGTPAMADAVARLLGEPACFGRVIAMAGHTDGLLSVGRSASEAGCALVRVLARALALS